MRRRGVAMIVLAGLAAAALAPSVSAAPAATKRVVSTPYELLEGEIGVGQPGPLVSTVTLPGGAENYVSLQLQDASGQAVLAEIAQQDTIATICGSTPEPLRIQPGFDVTVRIREGRCFGGGPSVATSGTIEATFERLPLVATESKAYSTIGTETVGWDDDPEMLVRTGEAYFLAAGRRYVSIEVTDPSGTVGAKIVQEERRSKLFCGTTDTPLEINSKLPFKVLVFNGRCDGAPSVATEGTVTVTFLKRP